MKLFDYLESHLPHRRMQRHHARIAWLASAVPARLREALPYRQARALPGRLATTAAMMVPRQASRGLTGGVVALAAVVLVASWFVMRRD